MLSDDLKTEMQGNVAALAGKQGEFSLVFEGDSAYTNGKEVVLPAIPDGIDIPEDVCKMLRGYIDHEAGGHLRSTDWKVSRKFFKTNPSFFEKSLVNILEDTRIENKLVEDLPGSHKNLKELTTQVLTEDRYLPTEESKQKAKEKTPEALLTSLMQTVRRDTYDLPKESVWDSLHPVAKEVAEKVPELLGKCRNTGDVIDLAEKIRKYYDTEDPTELEEWEPPSSSGDGDPQDGEESSESSESSSREGGPQDGDSSKDFESGDRAGAGPSLSDILGGKLKEAIDKSIDYTEGAYKPPRPLTTREDGYVPVEINGGLYSTDSYQSMVKSLGSKVNVMKAKLRIALLSKENRGWDVGRLDGTLDRKRLVGAYNRAPNIYKKREPTQDFDTSVTLLVDCSGSMSGQPIRTAKEITVAIMEALKGTQVDLKVVGHTSVMSDLYSMSRGSIHTSGQYYSRVEKVVLYDFKGWDESIQVCKPKIESMCGQDLMGNCDYDALKMVYEDLKKRQTTRKVLVSISDGAPANYIVNFPTQHLKTHMNDLQTRVLKKNGIETFGIGIEQPDIGRYYHNSVNVRDVSEFVTKGFKRMADILTK